MLAIGVLEVSLGIAIGMLVAHYVIANHGYYIMDRKKKVMAIVFGGRNARLAECAPDMYEMLTGICKNSECDGNCKACQILSIYEYIEHDNDNTISFNATKETLKDILNKEDKTC